MCNSNAGTTLLERRYLISGNARVYSWFVVESESAGLQDMGILQECCLGAILTCLTWWNKTA